MNIAITNGTQPPQWRSVRHDYLPAAGEYLSGKKPGASWVWDEGAGVHRPMTATEATGAALSALRSRLSAERNRHSDIMIAGSTDLAHVTRTQANTLMAAAAMLNAARQRPLTAEEDGLASVLEVIPIMIQAIDDAEAAISAWVDANLLTVAALDAFDVTAPPPEAPQWP